jgi:hypothetical protein
MIDRNSWSSELHEPIGKEKFKPLPLLGEHTREVLTELLGYLLEEWKRSY